MAASTFLEVLSKSDNQLDEEFLSGSDQEDQHDVDDFHHTKMLDAIRSLGGKKRVTQRTEPSLTVSEYNLLQAEKEKVPMRQLMMNLKGSTEAHRQMKNQMRAITRSATVLPVPLPKPQQERIQRQVAYQKVEGEVSKWEPVVKKNRLAEQLVFPLKQPDLRMQPTEKFVQRFKPKTALEIEVQKLLKGSDHVLRDSAELTPAEERALQAMSVEEAQERHNELKKMRALLSYQEMKARRQNKIKSKKYHRILKKERLRNQMKEFEELKQSNPELALEKLKDLEKQRVLERVSLRHRNTGKWAKQQMLRTKYNQESREALLKQVELSRQLTHKSIIGSSSEGDDSGDETVPEPSLPSGLESQFFSSCNPWLKNPHACVNVGSGEAENCSVGGEDDVTVDSKGSEMNGERPAEGMREAGTESDSKKAAHTGCENLESVNVDKGDDDADAKHDIDGEQSKEKGKPVIGSNDKDGRHSARIVGGAKKKKVRQKRSALDRTEDNSARTVDENDTAEVPAAPSKVLKGAKEGVKGKVQKKTKKNLERSKGNRLRQEEEPTKQVRKKGAGQKRKQKASVRNAADIDELFDAFERRGVQRAASADGDAEDVSDKEMETTVAETNDTQEAEVVTELDETLERRQILEDLEKEAMDAVEEVQNEGRQQDCIPQNHVEQRKERSTRAEVDPTKFIDVHPIALKSQGLDLRGPADEALNDDGEEEDQAVTISEAFADDDVISAFREEKEAQVKKDAPVGVDLYLPGWGSWAGAGIEPDTRKQKRYFRKPPLGAPRKDHDLGHVIINEKKDEKVAAHQVNTLPYEFGKANLFEATISHPIGSLWNTETAFRDLTAPKVITKQGAIIEPIDAESSLLKKDLDSRKGLPMAKQKVVRKDKQEGINGGKKKKNK